MTSYNFKVVLLGQGCVGKTSLVLRYVSNVFNDSHQSTLQASFLKKQLYLEQNLIRLNIWDTAGQEKFHALGPIYYREANGALLVYDVTSEDSLRKVRDWIKELNKMLGTQNIRLAIIGNKVDLLPNWQADPKLAVQASPLIQEAIKLSDELQNGRHYLTSAKCNQGIGDLFVSLSKRMVEQQKRLQAAAAQSRDNRTIANSKVMRTISLTNDDDDSDGGGGGGGGGDGVRGRSAGQRSASNNYNNNKNSSCQC